MSNPWDDVDTGAAAAPSAAVTIPAPAAPSGDGPWNDAQPAAAAPAVPEGYTVATVQTDKGAKPKRVAISPDGKTTIPLDDDAPTHEEQRSALPDTTAGGAVWRGLEDAIPGVDWLGGLANKAGSALGWNSTDPNMSVADRVRALQQLRAQEEAADKQNHPLAHYGAEAAGMLGGAVATGGLGEAAEAGMLANGAKGAAAGAVYGAGDADPSHVVAGAGEGALAGGAVGALGGPALHLAAKPLVQLADRLGINRLTNGDAAGLAALLRRSPQDINAVVAKADQMRAAGQEPTVLDLLDQGGKDTVAAANLRQPVTRDATVAYARERSAALPVDTAAAVDANVSPTTMTTPELREQVAQTRKALNDHNYRQLDPQTVSMAGADDLKSMLATPGGSRVLTTARNSVTDPDIAKQIGKLGSWAKTQEFDPAKHLTADQKSTLGQLTTMRDKSPVGSPQRAAWQKEIDGALAQAKASYDAARPNAQPPTDITHAALDLVRKTAGKVSDTAAKGMDATLGVPEQYGNLKRAIGDHIDANLPDAVTARATHGAYSRVLNAIDSSGKAGGGATINGSDFVDKGTAQGSEGNFQNFAPWAEGLSDGQLPLLHSDGSPILDKAGKQVTISERDAAKASAANAMKVASSAPVPARSQMRNFSENTAQDIKGAALLGDEPAARLKAALGASMERDQNASVLAGRAQSPTARLRGDVEGGAEAMHGIGAAAAVVSHGAAAAPFALRTIGSMMRRAGLNPEDAADMVNMAIAPGGADDFIAQLTKRGASAANARIIYNVARRAAGGVAGSGVQAPAAKKTKYVTLTGE